MSCLWWSSTNLIERNFSAILEEQRKQKKMLNQNKKAKQYPIFLFIHFVLYYKTWVSITSSPLLLNYCFEDPKRVITIMLLNGRKESEKQCSLQKHLNISAKLIPTQGFQRIFSCLGERGFYVYSGKFMQNFI